MAQTALNSLKMLMENQTATAHNLSNLSTPGFRQDVVTDFGSIYLNRQNGVEPRIVSSRNVGGFSIQQGTMDFTKIQWMLLSMEMDILLFNQKMVAIHLYQEEVT